MDPAQGIVDQPVTADEMAAIDQAASQYGAIVQPTTFQPATSATSGSVPGVVKPSGSVATDEVIADETPTAIIDEAFVEPEPVVAEEEVTPAPEEAISAPIDETPQASNDFVEPAIEETPEVAVEVVADEPVIETEPTDEGTTMTVVPAIESGAGTDEELLTVKQQALEELTPIVDTLELPAEERFDTLMMIIRASDDKRLVKPAFEAANAITDSDKKARALLDVVNEVNYLTQNQPDQE